MLFSYGCFSFFANLNDWNVVQLSCTDRLPESNAIQMPKHICLADFVPILIFHVKSEFIKTVYTWVIISYLTENTVVFYYKQMSANVIQRNIRLLLWDRR